MARRASPISAPSGSPRFVRLCDALPSTPTNKILTRTLVHEKFRPDRVAGDPLYRRVRGTPEFGPFTETDESALHAEFESHGRARAWDL